MRIREDPKIKETKQMSLSYVLVAGLLSICTFACNYAPANSGPPPTPKAAATPFEFDREKARAKSDAIVDAFMKNDRPLLRSKMETAMQEYYDQPAFDDILDQVIGAFGSPKEVQFKKADQGQKVGPGYDKPILKHWYAVKTSKSDYSSLNYIFVEIVPDGDDYASSGFSIVNFPKGVPEEMR